MSSINIAWITDSAEIKRHEQEWEELCRNVSEPNVFYEPWMALPALKFLKNQGQPGFLFVRHGSELVAVFPLEIRSHLRGLPLRHLSFWRYEHCYLCTPLIRRGFESECATLLLDWWESEMPLRCHLFFFDYQDFDGDFMRALAKVLAFRPKYLRYSNSYARAMYRRVSQTITCQDDVVSKKQRRNLSRVESRLSERGEISYVFSEVPDARSWIKQFLELEASGWKGKQGSALNCSEGGRKFAQEFLEAGFRRGRILPASLYLNGKLISAWIDLLAGDGAFSFKTGYNEAYAKFSPTTLLLRMYLKRIRSDPRISWIDTCASPDQKLANRLFKDRKRIYFIYVAHRFVPGGMTVMAMKAFSKGRDVLRMIKPKFR